MSAVAHRASLSDLFNFEEYELAYPEQYSLFDEPSKDLSIFGDIPEPLTFAETSSDSSSEDGSSTSNSFSSSSSDVDATVDRFWAMCDEDDTFTSTDSQPYYPRVGSPPVANDFTYHDTENDTPAFAMYPEPAPHSHTSIANDTLPILPSTPLKNTRRVHQLYTISARDDDYEDGGDDSDDSDEYVPSSSTSRKRVSNRQRTTRRSALRARRDMSSRPKSALPYSRRVRAPPGPRNKQTDKSLSDHKVVNSRKDNDILVCPECGWTQSTARSPDFNRHLLTHNRPSEEDQTQGWWCKGVLMSQSHSEDIPEGTEPYIFDGKLRVGGCLQTFSRRDALKRHLDNDKITCVGKACWATSE